MVLQTLTLAEVKAKAREYYAAGKLTAQHPNPYSRMCVNNGADGHRCAVAAAFNDELIEAFQKGTIGLGVARGLVALDDESAISRIQSAHDEWAIASQHGFDNTPDKEAHFLTLIRED